MATTNTTTATTSYTTTATIPYTTTSWTINAPTISASITEPKQEEEKKVKTRLGVKTLYKDVRTGEIFKYAVAEGEPELYIKTDITCPCDERLYAVCLESGQRFCIPDTDAVTIVKATIETCEA